MSFTPYLTEPKNGDPWFTMTDYKGVVYGGYSPCIPGRWQAWTGSTLCNCVGWAWGRAAQLENNKQCNIGCPAGRISPVNAQNWIDYPRGRKTGKTPKLGAVACWVNPTWTSGHVAVVEQLNADGGWTSSESGYGLSGFKFRNRRYNRSSDKTGWIFRGFIYLNIDDPGPEPGTLQVGDNVEIIGTGKASSYGTGRTAYGIGYKRIIKRIYADRPYPYQVGTVKGTTGFYKADALKKI